MLWKAEREKFQGFAWKSHHISFLHGHKTISLGGQPKAALSTCPSCHSYLPTKEWHILCCSREANTFADYKITPFMTGDTEFPGIKADSLRKALNAWEARVWDRAGSSICASVLSLWNKKQELKERVQPLTLGGPSRQPKDLFRLHELCQHPSHWG